eukprot:44464_1
MATSFKKNLKNVDDDATHLLYGYIREIQEVMATKQHTRIIPDIVIKLCLLFYHSEDNVTVKNVIPIGTRCVVDVIEEQSDDTTNHQLQTEMHFDGYICEVIYEQNIRMFITTIENNKTTTHYEHGYLCLFSPQRNLIATRNFYIRSKHLNMEKRLTTAVTGSHNEGCLECLLL